MGKLETTDEGGSPEIAIQVKDGLLDDRSAASMSELFKALGDPTRIKIIHALLQHELNVHDLTVVLGMGQSAVSHQLRYLRNLRIVKRRKEGKTVYYSLDDNHIEQLFVLTLQHLEHD
ncbi:ArsR/SmtB family transcription factor [Paenibacillus sp. MMS18-CY102]|uniref:ArsR/SmtB family transcription factor n=1 Tax=Paenibacillus sp. MMS18-CY102 TaxID=2682849 RepID=UPI000FAFF856|nr:metalloregulator ArsR/SmtB family transcription factor [Paenibacillus sp. MMS18-CY102]MWC29924.1 metalloregulator ArsR/SmtB family transcription factor [Paenibacillus sp. MMS18-CY102]